MTGELILFEDKEVRTLEKDGETWLPLIDLSEAWGLDRTTLPKHIERNKDFFDGCSKDVDILSHDEITIEEQQCVNEVGLYLLLARVSKGKVKNPTVKSVITRFRKMVPKLIKQERVKQIVPEPQQPLIKDELDRARLLAEATGGRLAEFQKIALVKCGYADYAPALDAIPAITHGEPGVWMNPTEIGRLCGLSAREVNGWLYNHDFQYPAGPLWRLTAKGEEYGEEYPFQLSNRHTEIRIRWHKSVMAAAPGMRPIDQNQLALPSKAGAGS